MKRDETPNHPELCSFEGCRPHGSFAGRNFSVGENSPRRFACFRYLPVNHEKVNGIPTMLTYINRLSSDFVHQRLWEGSLGCKVAKNGNVGIFWDHVMIWIYPPTQMQFFTTRMTSNF